MRNTLLHPFGLALLLANLVLAGLVVSVLDRWSRQAPWILLLGLLAYAASTAVLHRTRPIQGHSSDSGDTELDPPKDEASGPDSLVLRRGVQEALQKLDSLGALSQCDLLPVLPEPLLPVGLKGPVWVTLRRWRKPSPCVRCSSPPSNS